MALVRDCVDHLHLPSLTHRHNKLMDSQARRTARLARIFWPQQGSEIFFWRQVFWSNGIIFHQPRFPWNKGISLPLATFWGEVVWGRYFLARSFWTKWTTGLQIVICDLQVQLRLPVWAQCLDIPSHLWVFASSFSRNAPCLQKKPAHHQNPNNPKVQPNQTPNGTGTCISFRRSAKRGMSWLDTTIQHFKTWEIPKKSVILDVPGG